ncbi:MAG: TorA maturation chaperone TorD [Pseudohongiellaceae bacterium]|jgi:TorA maturation chaperone TorD
MNAAAELQALVNTAKLFGDLLLRELTAEQLATLRSPEAAAALAEVGVDVPQAMDGDDARRQLDELAAEYHASFIAPHGGGAPPIASLWTEGRYEGAVAARIRVLARSAVVDFDAESARGAPVDHLGALLHLWAATSARAPWVAQEIASQHLAWTDEPLGRVAASSSGFYGDIARATGALVAVLREDATGND